MSVPVLVGGIVLRDYDLPGAIVFAAAYGLLVPVFAYRLFDKRSRSVIVIHGIIFTVERPIMFSLRASVAARPNTEWPGLTKYMQANFALAYLGLAAIVLRLVRVVLVNTTNRIPASDGEVVKSDHHTSAPNVDEPRRRFWFRRWTDFLTVVHLNALVLGIVATASLYPASDTGQNHAHQAMRYASSAIGLVFILLESLTLLWASKTLPRINQRAVRFLLVLTTLLTIPPIYRLVVMRSTTPDIHSPGHQAQNTGADKAAFYVVHLLPEWIVVFCLCAFNVKDICQTGFTGDNRWWDETPKEREKREKKEQERARKKAEKENAGSELKGKNSNIINESAATIA
ncbi:hypothetical protein MVEN_01922400 [Mycena venus]|uniref:Uncharacterized protein n=1 Tax=Mycena venus TaxID=2733690 RepID=A0A8H7CJJ1_9AGAR|nr:hypothetical protein MVEN_01922400 [Mycena venus]